MEGEDSRPAGGPCAVEGHVQNAVRGLNAVLLQGEKKSRFGRVCSEISFFYFSSKTE